MFELLHSVGKAIPGNGLPKPKYRWPFSTNFNDSGPNAQHGTPTNATITTYKGRTGVRLPGNGYVALGSVEFGPGPWTFSTWILGSNWTGYSHLFTALTQANFAIKVGRTADGIGGKVYTYTGTMGSKIAATAMATDTWYWVTIVYDGSTLKYYRNGVLVDTFTSISLNIATQGFRIGQGNSTEYTNGYQSDTRIYDVALDATQINTLYQSLL